MIYASELNHIVGIYRSTETRNEVGGMSRSDPTLISTIRSRACPYTYVDQTRFGKAEVEYDYKFYMIPGVQIQTSDEIHWNNRVFSQCRVLNLDEMDEILVVFAKEVI
jgi:hypothetical protein